MRQLSAITALLLLTVTHKAHSAAYTLENTYNKLSSRYEQLRLPEDSPINELLLSEQHYQGQDKQHAITIMRPKSEQPLAVIMLVHGGGWGSGSPDILRTFAAKLAAQGYVVATPAYTLSSEAQFPAAINDLAMASNWLIKHASEFNINPQQFILAGGSAGGQMAALLAYSQGQLSSQTVKLTQKARLLINIDGLSDFTTPLALKYENDPNKQVTSASKWLGGKYEHIPETWHQASAINYLSAQSPATLFINGGFARFYAGKDAVQQQLTALGIANNDHVFSQAPHCFWLFQPWQNTTVTVIAEFINEQLNDSLSRLILE